MALSLPSPDDLTAHKAGVSEEVALQRAADLFTMATGITTTPSADTMEFRLIRTAILDMAWYLQEDHESREAQFSPFSSERIGSYSYTKMQKSVQAKEDTGVSGFDQAVEYFNGLKPSIITMDSEWVFANGYSNGSESKMFHDPSETFDTSELIVVSSGPWFVDEPDNSAPLLVDEAGFPFTSTEDGPGDYSIDSDGFPFTQVGN